MKSGHFRQLQASTYLTLVGPCRRIAEPSRNPLEACIRHRLAGHDETTLARVLQAGRRNEASEFDKTCCGTANQLTPAIPP